MINEVFDNFIRENWNLRGASDSTPLIDMLERKRERESVQERTVASGWKKEERL